MYEQIPGVPQNYTFNKVLQNISYICETKSITKGATLLDEGGKTNRLFIVKSGQVSLFKKIPSKSMTDKNCFKSHKILDLGTGDIFGEDALFFECPNRFTAKVTSIGTSIISIKNSDF